MTDKTITYHEEDGNIILKYQADVEALLKRNADLRALRGTTEARGAMHHIMTIDQVTLQDVCSKYKLDFFNEDDAKVILKILQGPDYQKFRTTDRKL
jgi:hypothetical protein